MTAWTARRTRLRGPSQCSTTNFIDISAVAYDGIDCYWTDWNNRLIGKRYLGELYSSIQSFRVLRPGWCYSTSWVQQLRYDSQTCSQNSHILRNFEIYTSGYKTQKSYDLHDWFERKWLGLFSLYKCLDRGVTVLAFVVWVSTTFCSYCLCVYPTVLKIYTFDE